MVFLPPIRHPSGNTLNYRAVNLKILLNRQNIFWDSFVFIVQSLSRVRLCSSMNCSMPGFPVLHYLSKFVQTHVHWVTMSSNHLILCCPLLLLPSIFPTIKGFSNESALRIRWPKYWSFSISPSNIYKTSIHLFILRLVPVAASAGAWWIWSVGTQFLPEETSLHTAPQRGHKGRSQEAMLESRPS